MNLFMTFSYKLRMQESKFMNKVSMFMSPSLTAKQCILYEGTYNVVTVIGLMTASL